MLLPTDELYLWESFSTYNMTKYAHTDSLFLFLSLPLPFSLLLCLVCQVLHEEWARYSAFYKYQPIDLVR